MLLKLVNKIKQANLSTFSSFFSTSALSSEEGGDFGACAGCAGDKEESRGTQIGPSALGVGLSSQELRLKE